MKFDPHCKRPKIRTNVGKSKKRRDDGFREQEWKLKKLKIEKPESFDFTSLRNFEIWEKRKSEKPKITKSQKLKFSDSGITLAEGHDQQTKGEA